MYAHVCETLDESTLEVRRRSKATGNFESMKFCELERLLVVLFYGAFLPGYLFLNTFAVQPPKSQAIDEVAV